MDELQLVTMWHVQSRPLDELAIDIDVACAIPAVGVVKMGASVAHTVLALG